MELPCLLMNSTSMQEIHFLVTLTPEKMARKLSNHQGTIGKWLHHLWIYPFNSYLVVLLPLLLEITRSTTNKVSIYFNGVNWYMQIFANIGTTTDCHLMLDNKHGQPTSTKKIWYNSYELSGMVQPFSSWWFQPIFQTNESSWMISLSRHKQKLPLKQPPYSGSKEPCSRFRCGKATIFW